MRERVFLEGENIYLRGLQKRDLEGNYLNWFDDADVCRHNSHHRFPMSEAEVVKYVESISGRNDILVLAIIEQKEKIHIGNISLQNINYINRSAEFAIILGEKRFQGMGYSKEAGKLIVGHGFSVLNLNRIYCGTSSENIPMQKLAGYLGFSEEGIRRKAEYKNNKYVNIIEYGLLKEESDRN